MIEFIIEFFENTGIAQFFVEGGWKFLLMILLSLFMLYLAIFKKFEPYLLIPIAFGMLLVNLPGSGMFVKTQVTTDDGIVTSYSGLLGYLYYGVKIGRASCRERV